MWRRTAYMGMYLAVALILSYVESLIPISVGIPGVKLGLANLIVVIMLYLADWREALLISVLRIVLSGAMFGNLFGILYGLAGGLFSFLVMALLIKSDRFHVVTVSICGGVAHNMAQLVVAAFLVESYYVIYYMPVLLIAGMLTGTLVGIISREAGRRLPAGLWSKRSES